MSQFMLNMDAVNKEAEKMESLSNGGIGFFSRKKIPAGGEVDIRILPPLKSLNGLYYLKRTTVWINNKPYLSPRTFNEPCPILDFVDSIKKGVDDDMKTLVNAKAFNISVDYLLPILLLQPKYENGSLISLEVIDDCAKVFDCTWGLIKSFNAALSNRHYQNNTKLGLFDREQGRNLTISKEVTPQRTSYASLVWPNITPLDEKYYENVPDVVDICKKSLYTNDTLEKVALNYFTGSAMPDLVKKFPKQESKSAENTSQQNFDKKDVAKTSEITTKSSTGGSLLDRLRNS